MTKIFVPILALLAFIGGGVLLYNAAEEGIEPREAIVYPDIEVPTGTEQMLPVQKETKTEKKQHSTSPESACIYVDMVNRKYEANSPQECWLVDFM